MRIFRSFLGLCMIVVLSIGLASTSGCSTTMPQEKQAALPTSQTLINQPTTEIPVNQPTTETLVTESTMETLVVQPIPETQVTQPTSIPNTGNTTDNQELITVIQESLLADTRSKAEQPSPGIYYVDAVTAKNLVDETAAIFMDARYLVDYDVAHISGAINLPVSSVWKNLIDPVTILPDKEAVLIAYCSPGCPAGLELARELSIRGYHNLFVLNGGYLAWEDAGYAMYKQELKL